MRTQKGRGIDEVALALSAHATVQDMQTCCSPSGLGYIKLENSKLCANQPHLLSACGPPSCMLTMCCNLCILPLQISGIVLTPAAQRATKMERRHSQKESMQKRFRNELPKSDSQ